MEFVGSVVEVDVVVVGDVEVVGEGEGDIVGFGGEGFYFVLWIDV